MCATAGTTSARTSTALRSTHRRAVIAATAAGATIDVRFEGRHMGHDSMDDQPPKLYGELASWFHLLTAPADYAEDAAFYGDTLSQACDQEPETLLELGSGGGNTASHLNERFQMTLVDRSPEMLALSETINPECEHLEGDMRTLRLDRIFDAVLIHDAISYMASEDDLRQAIETAFLHCAQEGRPSSPRTSSERLFARRTTAEATTVQSEVSGISNGSGTLTRPTRPTSATSPTCSERLTVPFALSTTVTPWGSSRATSGSVRWTTLGSMPGSCPSITARSGPKPTKRSWQSGSAAQGARWPSKTTRSLDLGARRH